MLLEENIKTQLLESLFKQNKSCTPKEINNLNDFFNLQHNFLTENIFETYNFLQFENEYSFYKIVNLKEINNNLIIKDRIKENQDFFVKIIIYFYPKENSKTDKIFISYKEIKPIDNSAFNPLYYNTMFYNNMFDTYKYTLKRLCSLNYQNEFNLNYFLLPNFIEVGINNKELFIDNYEWNCDDANKIKTFVQNYIKHIFNITAEEKKLIEINLF